MSIFKNSFIRSLHYYKNDRILEGVLKNLVGQVKEGDGARYLGLTIAACFIL